MSTKARPAKVKAGEDQGLEVGQFEAIVSVFGNTDSVGDKVLPGAFEKSLAEWAERDKPIPVIFTHSHGDAFAYIGDVLAAEEREGEGLWIKGQLDVDPDAENPTARQVYRLLKGGRIDNWSFAYDVVDEGPGDDGANELRQLALYEVGPTLIGANQETRTLAVKARAKAAVAPHQTGTSEAEWDGPGNEANLSNEAGAATYRKAFAWVDPDGDPDAKASYKFIHHEVSADGTVGAANLTACTTAIGVLNGGRGGADIPDADVQGVYDHLAKHLRDADAEPPELASKSRAKAGRTLSGKNEQKIRDAVSALQDVLSSLGEANDDGKASGHGPAKDETREGKSEEPSPAPSAHYRSAQMQLLALGEGEGGSP